MDGHTSFRTALKPLAVLSGIGGVLALMDGVLSATSMGARFLNGDAKHDAIISTFLLVPVLQLICVAYASKNEGTRPAIAHRLYAAVVIIFAAFVAMLALA